MPKRRLRFGFHNFLNAQPILISLNRRVEEAGLEMVLGAPSAMSELLGRGELDLAMIPSIEYLKGAEKYLLVPGLAIASRGPVGTVLLASLKPLDQIRSLALDNRSKTSVALLRLLFEKKFAADVRYDSVEPDPGTMLASHDAALIIGDQSFNLGLREGLTFYDLSEEWFRLTGKAFVHAVVAVSPQVDLGADTVRLIQQAKKEAVAKIGEMISSLAEKFGVDPKVCEDYLREKIVYDLGEPELDGLKKFQELCFAQGLLPQKHPLKFI